MAARNCEGTADPETVALALPFAPDLRQCPRSAVDELAWEWLALYAAHKMSRALPFPGGWDDQPAYVGQAFEALATAEYEQQAQETARTRGLIERAAKEGGGGRGV